MKKAVMYGAGNIGRGFIGQLLSESDYEVSFIDVNLEIVDKLNNAKEYPIVFLTGKESKELLIQNVKGVNGNDLEAVSTEISDSDLLATAVGVNVLPMIAKPIALGLIKRWKDRNFTPLNILICENLLDANHYLARLIKEHLNAEEKAYFDELIGLVEASIGRMVPLMTAEMQSGNILRVCVEEYSELPVDKSAFKGEIPFIKNLKPFIPFDFYIQRKLYIHNMGHALTAYLGHIKGYQFIWEAINDPYIRYAVSKAMQDSAVALSKEHGVSIYEILDHVDDLIYRFGNKQLGDTIARVGNDTKRKLAPSDRLIGAAKLCMKYRINPAYLSLGIAAAMEFKAESFGVYSIIHQHNPKFFLNEFCKLDDGDSLFQSILHAYELFEANLSVDQIIDLTLELRLRNIS